MPKSSIKSRKDIKQLKIKTLQVSSREKYKSEISLWIILKIKTNAYKMQIWISKEPVRQIKQIIILLIKPTSKSVMEHL